MKKTRTSKRKVWMCPIIQSFFLKKERNQLTSIAAMHIQAIFRFGCFSESASTHNAHFKWKICIIELFISSHIFYAVFIYTCIVYFMQYFLSVFNIPCISIRPKHRHLYNINVHATGTLGYGWTKSKRREREKTLLLLADSFDCLFIYLFIWLVNCCQDIYTNVFNWKIYHMIWYICIYASILFISL